MTFPNMMKYVVKKKYEKKKEWMNECVREFFVYCREK